MHAADRTLHAIDATLTATEAPMTEPRTFAAYLDRHERDQLDARAATAEQERDDARDDLKEVRDSARRALQALRTQLLTALGKEDDNQTLASYITALTAQRDQFRAEANRAHGLVIAAERERDDLAEELRDTQAHHTQLHNRTTVLTNDLRSQTRAVREAVAETETVATELAEERTLHDRTREQLIRAEWSIAAQAEQIRRNGTLICRLKDLDEQADRIAAWRDRAWVDHDTTDRPAEINTDGPEEVDGYPSEGAALADALERAESAIIDRDDSVWRPGDGGHWTSRHMTPMTRDDIEKTFGPTRTVLLIDIDQDEEQDGDSTDADRPPVGSADPRAQDQPDPLHTARLDRNGWVWFPDGDGRWRGAGTCHLNASSETLERLHGPTAEAVVVPVDRATGRPHDDLTDRLAAALARLMRRNGGEGISPTTWQTWEAMLAEHANRTARES
ncbi:hypothetical protein [Micromonospora endolithica]|uniref:Uncharacterized protein n=1 Tax=Micromonospora endolithica TaxID=230091 RepID=A0A3A9YR35_9ACTN|nr:hypothetical protein [Micromonospora endolithica]RKN38468.1 hypothetical protein D7223_31180 [Micromonospora endolithica]TWJ23109.1 hypothetical protein JD76_03238 [Micromonospora endolithica]